MTDRRGQRLVEAAQVITRRDFDAAAAAAARLLSVSGPDAPLGPPSRFTTASYDPFVAAVHVHAVRDQLRRADLLMSRAATLSTRLQQEPALSTTSPDAEPDTTPSACVVPLSPPPRRTHHHPS